MASFCLAGGTALALYLGHRKSVDLDFFSPMPFDVSVLRGVLEVKYGFCTDFVAKNTLRGHIGGIKVDCITHAYERLAEPYVEDGIRLYALEDIVAMKLSAITDNGSRLKDFIDIYKGQSTTDSIYDAAYNINPKTGLFDRRILEKSREMEGNGISQLYTNQTALSCIDLKTGEFSPVAQELVDFFYPPRNSTAMKSLKNSIKNQYITWSKVDFDLEDNPSFLIDCLKNKDGEFDEVNLNYVFKIIKMYRSVFSCITVYFSDIVDIMNYIKDENGVADKNKFNNIKSIYKMLPHQDDVIRIVKALEKFPEEKRKSIFETCSSLGQYEDVVSLNFEVLSGFCFDKDGNKIQSNIDYIMELFEINGEFVFHQEFIDICVKNPELRRFLQEVLSNFKNENCLDKIKDVIPAYQREDGSIPDFVKDKILEYTKSGRDLNGFTDVFNYCLRQTNGNYESGFNYDMFNKVLDFRKLARAAKSFKVINYANEYINIVNGNLNLGHMDFKDKVSILNGLTKIQEYIEKNNISGYDYIEKSISTIEAGLKLEDIALPIDKETKTEFLANILFSREDYTGFEQIMIDSIPVLESMNEGLTLAYPRAEFLNDLTLICQNDEDIEILKQKAGIVPIFSDKGQRIIVGYNGLIKLSDLDVNNPKEKQIYDCLSKFMYKNEVKTGNKALDEQLNIIIKTCPEFINTIGKKQHATHEYTLDIHSLLVMAYSMANPDYNRKLNSLDKTLLKISAIFHDIMKQENVVDKGHQNLSSLYTRSIIQKIFNSPEIQDRVFGLVDNHHWGEELSNTPDFERTAKELAFKFRRPNDFEIAKIMADSDLRAVSENFYEHRKGNLTSDKLDIIGKNIKYLYSNGNAVFSDYFVSPSSLEKHIQIKDGRSYKVVNMNSIPDNADMGEYGFRSGIKKTDLRFLVHMVDERDIYNNLNTVKLLTSPFNGGVLSESLISPKYNRTYSNREYGLLLSQENVNIVNEASSNQGSGIKKGFSKIIDLVFNNNFAEDRNNFKSQLLYYLGINPKDVSSEDYAEFYKNVLSAKTSLQQISTEKIYKLGSFSITGGDLIKAIKEYQDGLIDKQEKKHNEIIGYIPKIHAVIAKGKSINALPEGLLNFAYENNYPIILI